MYATILENLRKSELNEKSLILYFIIAFNTVQTAYYDHE